MAALITLWTRFGAAAQNDFTGSDPGQTLLNQHFARQSGDTLTLAIESRQKITDPAVQSHASPGPWRRSATAPHVTGVAGPYTTPGHLAPNGHVGYATVQFDVSGAHISNAEATALMHDAAAASGHGSDVQPGRQRGRPGRDAVRRRPRTGSAWARRRSCC